jgi:hypothetical protein
MVKLRFDNSVSKYLKAHVSLNLVQRVQSKQEKILEKWVVLFAFSVPENEVLLQFRAIEVTQKNILQAQSLRKDSRRILELLDSPDTANITEDVKKLAKSFLATSDLVFTPKPEKSYRGDDSTRVEQSELSILARSFGHLLSSPLSLSDPDSDSVSSRSSSF